MSVAILTLCLAVLGIGFYIAGLDDSLNVFTDQHGIDQVSLLTAFPSTLLWAIPIGVLIVAALWLASSLIASRFAHIPLRKAALFDAVTWLPLALLVIVPLRYIPTLGAANSFIFLLSSTLAWPLLVIAILISLTLKWSALRAPESPSSPGASGRATGWIVFAVAAVAFAVAIPCFNAGWSFGGDEPHYLIIAHSIAEDGDILIEDDHAAGVWRDFTDHEIHPQYLRRSASGEIIPFHKIGLPLLAALPYMLIGRLGAVLLIGLLAAIAAANAYWLAFKVVRDRTAALLSTAWVSLTVPVLPMSFLFFSEIPTLAFTLIAFNMIIQTDGKSPRWPWLLPFVIWTLPWFHARGLITAAALTAFLLWRLRGKPAKAAAVALLCLLPAMALPLWNWAIYGDFNPIAEMGADQDVSLGLGNILRGIGGLLFDQEFGLLLYNPVVVFALVGLYFLWKKNREAAVWTVLIIGSSIGPGMLYAMWWGGGSPPARYAAAAFSLAALPLAAFIANGRGKRWLRPVVILASLSAILAVFLMVRSDLLVNHRDGASLLLTAVSAGPIDAVEWWPSFIEGGIRAWPLAALLTAAAAVSVALLLLWSRIVMPNDTRRDEKPLRQALGWTGGLAITLLFAGFYSVTAEALTPGEPNGMMPQSRQSALHYQLLWRHAGHRAVDQLGSLSPDSLPPRGFSGEHLFSASGLSADDKAPRGRSLRIAPGRFEIALQPEKPFWAGSYRLRIGLRSDDEPASVRLSVFDSALSAGKSWQPSASVAAKPGGEFEDAVIPLVLPRNTQSLLIAFETDRTARFIHAILEPLELVRKPQSHLPFELFDKLSWRMPGYDLYTDPGAIYRPEGDAFWTLGDSDTALTIASSRAFSSVELRLQGNRFVDAEIELGGESAAEGFGPRKQEAVIKREVAPRRFGELWLTDVRIDARGTFVPADHVEGSQDHRTLGVFVRIALK